MADRAFQCALSTCGVQELTKEHFDLWARAQLAMEVTYFHNCIDIPDWQRNFRLAKDAGVEILSYHLPFDPRAGIRVASLIREEREASKKILSSLIQPAGENGVKTIIVHPSAEPYPEEEREERLACAMETLSALAEVASRAGSVLAVENLPRTCLGRDSADMKRLLSADSRLRSCFDTNHLLGENPIEYIKNVAGLIVTTHFSDYDFLNERHWLPGEGKTNWPGLMAALKAAGYAGPLLYEVSFAAPQTIERRQLEPEDFRRNYEYLMRGETPPAIGKPILEKCAYWKKN